MRLNLKIGQKLALSAGLAAILVLAMVVSSRFALQEIDGGAGDVAQHAVRVQLLNESRRDVVETRTLYQQAVLSHGEAIDRTVANFDALVAQTASRLDKLAADSTDRDRIARAKAILAEYAPRWHRIVENHRKVEALQGQAAAAGDAWRNALAKLNGLEPEGVVAAAIDNANAAFNLAGAKQWRLVATNDMQQKEQGLRALDEGFTNLRVFADRLGPPAKEAIAAAEQLHHVLAGTAAAITARLEVTREAAPLREEMTTLIDGCLASGNQQNSTVITAMRNSVSSTQTIQMVVGALVLAVMFACAAFGALAIGRPIRNIAGVLEKLAGGDKSVAVPYVGRGDEVGETARAAEVFKQNLVRMDQLAAEQATAEARAEAAKKEAIHKLANDFEHAVGGIVNAVTGASTQLQGAAQSMSAAAEQTNRQSTAVAAAAEEASSNVETVATAAEELSSSISEIARRVNESAQIAAEAVREADATATKVGHLSLAAQKIGDIVGLISTIASQTNLLALNATIEAARAGDAGRGFAVVASEVKTLADQTAKATGEISRQIEDMQRSTSESASAIDAITAVIRKMNEISATIAAAVEEQGAATVEIARNVQQASTGTGEVTSNIVGVTQAAASSSAASAQVLASASSLTDQAKLLGAEVQNFLATVRTGAANRRVADDPNYRGPERRADRQGAAHRAA